MKIINCLFCKKEFNGESWKGYTQKFCSHKCYWLSMKENPEYKGFWYGKKRILTPEIINKFKLQANRIHTGRKRPKETGERISKALKGKVVSLEVREKIRNTLKGRKNTTEQIQKWKKMRKDWHPTKEHIEKIRISNLGRVHAPVSEETKRKLSLGNKGKKRTIEQRKKLSIAAIKRRPFQIIPLQDTSIEKKIQHFLIMLEVPFMTHRPMMEIKHAYPCDIYIPKFNLVIECDGNYWHKYPEGLPIDKIRNIELKNKGFKICRIWEHEIRNLTIVDFENKLEEFGYERKEK